MEYNLDQALQILSRTPAVLRSFLSGLDDEWTQQNEGPETWSPYDIVGHLIHGDETDWIARAEMILEHGESKAFVPFDRFAQFEESRGKTVGMLLDEFEEVRARKLDELRALEISAEKLQLKGKHPALGQVTLSQLLSAWVTHDLGHIAQISRVMAKQYGDQIGPWRQYIPIVSDRT